MAAGAGGGGGGGAVARILVLSISLMTAEKSIFRTHPLGIHIEMCFVKVHVPGTIVMVL